MLMTIVLAQAANLQHQHTKNAQRDIVVPKQNMWITSTAGECMDMDHIAAGTIIDPEYQTFTDGATDIVVTHDVLSPKLEVRVNTEARSGKFGGATLAIVHPNELPYAYSNNEGDMNSCNSNEALNGAGIALMPKEISDRCWGSNTRTKVPDFRRKDFTVNVKEIEFTFLEAGVDHFELTTSDFGDFPRGATVAANVYLKGYDANGTLVDSDTYTLDIHTAQGRNSHDGCGAASVLRIDTSGGVHLSKATMTFQWEINGTVYDNIFDPNFHIAQLCFPNAYTPEVKDDPHFVGFDGSTYDFNGQPGEVFNLITDTDFQVNTLFIEASDGKTYMGQIAMLAGENEILVQPSDKTKATLNGREIQEMQTLLRDDEGHNIGVLEVHNGIVSVVSGGFMLQVSTVRWGNDMHLNFHASAQSQHLNNPHGLLGQTAQFLVTGEEPNPVHLSHKNKNAMGFIEGQPSDYVVADGLYGVMFSFNRYHVHEEKKSTANFIYRENRHAIARAVTN